MDGVGGGRRLSWAEEIHMRERERERESTVREGNRGMKISGVS
jgi:hypothetical protein